MKIVLALILILVPSLAVPQGLKRKRIGSAEYCVVTVYTIECTTHTMAECLSAANMISDAIVCLTLEEILEQK